MVKSIIAASIVMLFLYGCGTSAVNFTVKRPSAINMKGHKRIAVGTVSGERQNHSSVIANMVTEELLESRAFDAVLDRKYIADILLEHKLQLSGLVDENSIMELGKFTGAAALIYATINEDKYVESISRADIVVTNQVATGKKDAYDRAIYSNAYENMIRYDRKGMYGISVSFQLIDIETAKLITARTLVDKKDLSSSSTKQIPAAPDTESAFMDSARSLCRKFVNNLVPSYVKVIAYFQVDGELPEVDGAIRKIQAGLMEEAIDSFDKMTRKQGLKQEILAKTFYNLGLAQGFNSQFDVAVKNINRAIDLNPKENLYGDALKQVMTEKANAAALKEQE